MNRNSYRSLELEMGETGKGMLSDTITAPRREWRDIVAADG
jgi:hypothetical protein